MILTPLQKLPKNVEDWGKLIVAKGFKRLPKISPHLVKAVHVNSFGYIQFVLPWLDHFGSKKEWCQRQRQQTLATYQIMLFNLALGTLRRHK